MFICPWGVSCCLHSLFCSQRRGEDWGVGMNWRKSFRRFWNLVENNGQKSWGRTFLAAFRDMETLSCWETTASPCHCGRKQVLSSVFINSRWRQSFMGASVHIFFLLDQQIWSAVAKGLEAKRLAKMSRVSRDGFRSPMVTMLLGEHSWVRHVDNRIRLASPPHQAVSLLWICSLNRLQLWSSLRF